MPTLSPLSQTQSAAEPTAMGDAPGASLVAIVHKQLAALESLAAEGRAEAGLLHTEIAELATRLSAMTARLARLEGTLASTERVLVAIRTGLLMIPAQQPETAQSPKPQPTTNGAESRLTVPTPTPVASTTAPIAPTSQPDQPPTASAHTSHEITPIAPDAPLNPPAPLTEQVAPSTRVAQRDPEGAETSAPPQTTPAAPPRATSAPAPAVPATQPEPQTSEQAAPASSIAPDTSPRIQRGSTVEVIFDDDTTETYTIVRQSEANRSRNLIGENTPLGQVLLGARVGDICRYRVANNPEIMVRVGAIA